MKAKNLKGKTITLKLKTSNFEVKTRATTIVSYTNEAETISKHVKKLLSKELPIRLRLMGIRVANFMGKSEPVEKNQKQLSTFFKKSDDTSTATQNDKILVPGKTTANIPIKPPVTVDGTVDENFVTCPKCNQQIRMSELFEHEDYHVAKDMKRKLRSISHQVTRKKQKATKKRTLNGQTSIVGFLRGKPS